MAGATVTLGILVTAAAGAAHGALQSLGQNMDRLKARTAEAARSHAQLGEKLALVGRQNRPIEGLSDAYVKLGRTIDQARAHAERFEAVQAKIAGHKAAAGELWGQAVGVAGLGIAMAAPVKAAMDFESAFADVRKVVDGTDEELNGLSAAIMRMGRSLPLAHTEIAALAAAGGQLGVALKDLPAFVETTAKMAVAFDMGANEAGDAMAKIANVYKIPIAEIGRLGDAINQISNESPAKASEIVRALSRVGGVAQAFGLSAEQASALSAAFIAMGKPPEVAGTAINALLIKLQTADKQGAKFQAALASMGMSAGALKQAIGEDAQGALLGFLKALESVPKEARTGVLVDLFGLEYSDDIAALAGNLDVYRQQLDAAARAQGSMGKEFAARAATTANNLQLLKNTVSELAINIGSVLLPALNGVLSSLRPVIEGLASWAKENPGVVSAIGKLTAALLAFKAGSLAARAAYHLMSIGVLGSIGRIQALRAAWISASLAIQTRSLAPLLGNAAPAAAGLLGRLREIVNSGAPMKAVGWHLAQIGGQAKGAALAVGGALKAALLGAGKAVLWLGRAVLMNPIGLALTAAALLVYKFWGPIKGFFKGLWDGITTGLAPVAGAFRAAFAPVAPLLDPVIGAFKTVIGWVGRLVSGVGDLLKPMDDAGGAAEALGRRVGQAIASAVQMFLSLPGKLLSLPGEMLRIGGEVVAGLIKGIKDKRASAGKAIEELGDSIKSRFKGWLGIKSPSRVFADFGQMIGQGAAQGIAGMAGAVGKATAGLALAATAAFQPAISADVPALHATKPGFVQTVEPIALPAVPEAVRRIGQTVEPIALPAVPEAVPKVGSGGTTAAPMQVTFSPTINVSAAGSNPAAVREQVSQAMQMSFAEFERLMRRYEAERRRIAPGGGWMS